MLALVDDWGNPSPGGGETDWFGFAAVLLHDNQVDRMKQWLQKICGCLGRLPLSPLHFRKLSESSKYHITCLLEAIRVSAGPKG